MALVLARWRVGLVALAAASQLCCAQSQTGAPIALPHSVPKATSSHVVTIVMENKEYGDVVGSSQAPFVNRLARRYGLATASYGVRHPSEPDYLALTSGSTHGINSDCTDCHASGRSVVDQLAAAGLTWKAYMEDLPRPCFRGAGAGGYAKKHDPFMYYDGLRSCRRVVGFGALARDLRRATMAIYAV